MRASLFRLAMAGCLMMIAGCASHPSTTTQAPPVAKTGQAGLGDEQFVPPPDAAWTIACLQFKGYGHVERAKATRQQLTAQTGLPAFYVVHESDVSTLYYGFYKEFRPSIDPAEGGRAQADLLAIRHIKNGVGDSLFPFCRITGLEPPDPIAPAEWNLLNVDRGKPDGDPTKAYWTLEIAVYKDSAQRKQAAVDTVKSMRAQYGLTNVYFYHGKTSSSVCIGAWPIDAVQQIQPERGSADDRIVVMGNGVPANFGDHVRDSEGKIVRPVDLQFKPIDPTLIDMMQKFDRRSVNGYDIKHTYNLKAGGTKDVYDPSQVVYIPRGESTSLLAGNDESTPAESSPPASSDDSGASSNGPTAGNTDGGAKLRSLNP